MRQLRRITGIEGLRSGSTARVKLPVNRRYFGLDFFATVDGVATAVASVVGRVRLYVNGLPMWDLPASYLLAEDARVGQSLAVGHLPFHFADPDRADKIDEQVTAWNLFGETSFEIEFEILAQAEGAVVGLEGLAVFDFGQTLTSDGKALKQCVKKFTVGKNANAGLNDLDNLPIRDAIQRLTFFGATLPTSFTIDADGNRILEATVEQLKTVYGAYGATPVSGSTPVRFDFTERIDDFLVVNKDLNVRFDMPSAAAVTLLVQTLAPAFI
jgi:hypothetical protein